MYSVFRGTQGYAEEQRHKWGAYAPCKHLKRLVDIPAANPKMAIGREYERNRARKFIKRGTAYHRSMLPPFPTASLGSDTG